MASMSNTGAKNSPPGATSSLESTLASLQTEKAALISSLSAELQKQRGSNKSRSDATSLENKHESEAVAHHETIKEANDLVKRHIKHLNSYNEMRDVGLMLMRLIAEQRGVRLSDITEEYGVGSED